MKLIRRLASKIVRKSATGAATSIRWGEHAEASLILLLPFNYLHALKDVHNVIDPAAFHAQLERSLVQGDDGGAALAILPQKALTQEPQGFVLTAVCQICSVHPAACVHAAVLKDHASTSRAALVSQNAGVAGQINTSQAWGCTSGTPINLQMCTALLSCTGSC